MAADTPAAPAADGFGLRGLGVARVQVAPEVYVATLPLPARTAVDRVAELRKAVEAARGSWQLVPFEVVDGFPTWIRARDVITIDVVPTDEPSE